MSTYDVTVTLTIRVKARDINAAENHVLSILDTHLSDMLDSPAVMSSTIPLTAINPTSVEVKEKS